MQKIEIEQRTTRKDKTMNKRLKYDRYRGMDNIITIDLHNGYTTITIISKQENVYDIQFMLKENSIDRWELIENAEHIAFNATPNTIYSAILKQVATYLDEGFFDYYIQRYEYDIQCANRGNDLYESERMSGSNV